MSADTTEWPVCAFAEVADYGVGRTPARARSDYWDLLGDGVPWVTISDMPAYGTVLATKESVSQSAFDGVFRGEVVPAGTLLMSFKLTIGRVATLGLPAVHNEAIISIYPKAGLDQRFLGYYLSQVDYAELQDRHIKGHTLNKSKIDRIPVPVPPEPEQRAIADVLDAVRSAIRTESDALAVTKELMHVTAHNIFTKGLRNESLKETAIGMMPESWEPRAIGELCQIWSGGTPRKSVSAYWRGDIPWVSGKDLKSPVIDDAIDHVSEEGVSSGSRIVPPGAVLLLVRGMGLAKDLPVATVTRPVAFNQDVKGLVSRGEYSGPFLRAAIYAGRHRLLAQIVTSAHGTMTLNLGDVAGMMIACPSDPTEADDIVETLDALDDKARLHEARLVVLDALFASLLSGIMSRELSTADVGTSQPALGATTA